MMKQAESKLKEIIKDFGITWNTDFTVNQLLDRLEHEGFIYQRENKKQYNEQKLAGFPVDVVGR